MKHTGLWYGYMGLGVVLGAAIASAGVASPQASRPAVSASTVHVQLKNVDAKLVAARAQQAALQAHVTELEQQNGERRQQLHQRDAEIATLQQKLGIAGAAASGSSAGH